MSGSDRLPYYEINNLKIEDWSVVYDGEPFHAVLCDPPYGLEFMGKEWDSFTLLGLPGNRHVPLPTPVSSSANPTCSICRGRQRGAKRCVCGKPIWKSIESPNPTYGKTKVQQMRMFQSQVTVWGEAIMPHLYPGALVLMFGGTRTWHRLACGMEDAGFEMWDTLMWLHGQGFPKAQDISKLIDKQNGDERAVIGKYRQPDGIVRTSLTGKKIYETGFDGTPHDPDITAAGSPQSAPWSGHKTTALKPAWEPVLCFKKPLDGTYAEVVMKYGSGALNVDGGRIGLNGEPAPTGSAKRVFKANQFTDAKLYGDNTTTSPLGRYPANLILDEESAAQLDQASGNHRTTWVSPTHKNNRNGEFLGELGHPGDQGFNDNGGASRFFYCAKASSAEREAGLREATVSDGRETPADNPYQRGATKRYNLHPTVKPIALCKYLATLLLPPVSIGERRLLVPFSGSGSEMIGALQAGWDEVVGVESDTDHGYCAIAEARVGHHWSKLVEQSLA